MDDVVDGVTDVVLDVEGEPEVVGLVDRLAPNDADGVELGSGDADVDGD